MTHASLFSGIGGFDLAAHWMGWENLFQCEKDPFCQTVLRHHFPKCILHGDIKELQADEYHGRVDVLTGGFPCQPYSTAGKRKGRDDDRHLWPEMLRVIRECQPRWVLGENVLGLRSWDGGMVFEEVCADLEARGYSVQPFVIPACGVKNAPHKRDRIWFVAYSHHPRVSPRPGGVQEPHGKVPQWNNDAKPCHTGARPLANSNSHNTQGGHEQRAQTETEKGDRAQAQSVPDGWQTFPNFPPVCGRHDGLPTQLDGVTFPKWRNESVKAYGNAIVPQVALQIFKAMQQYEDVTRV